MRIEDMILCCIEEPESRISWMLFQRISVLVSLHHNFFCSFFPVYIRIKIFSPSFIKTVSSEWKRAFLCSILKCVENKLFFLLLNIITTKISSERTAALIMKKKIDPTLSVYGKLNPSQPQPHENQLTQSTCNHIKTNCLPWWNLKTRTQGIYNL